MKIRKLRSIICLCLVFALLSPTFTFAISDGASDVAEKQFLITLWTCVVMAVDQQHILPV